MFKKALQVVTAFGVLLAGYAGYVRVFAIVAARVGRLHQPGLTHFAHESATLKEAIALAGKAFGPAHWTGDKGLQYRYYNDERGYWMYAREVVRSKDGKRLTLTPFALIWRSRDGRALKTATSDEAVIDLDQPLGLSNKPNTPGVRVVHAELKRDVWVRDDKGTPADPADDLKIGPMSYIEYDEPTLQIRSESDVVIVDRDMRATGLGLLILLRPKEEGAPGSGSGFDAKTIFLKKDPHITLSDVGNSGILPGAAGPEQKQGERTPLEVRGAGMMQLDLPKPRAVVRIGPPAPPLPTIATFNRDVVVVRGKLGQPPDQLNCDNLRLTLMPADKTAPAVKPGAAPGPAATPPQAPPGPGGMGTDLTLRRADATGHAVWLQSKSQGLTARCNELIHKKPGGGEPEETYLRADANKLWVEKIETVKAGPDQGKVTSVAMIRAIDLTIFDDGKGQGNDNATVVARGPGILEIRPARDRSVERQAIWQDHLVMQPEAGIDTQAGKRITLTGHPKFFDFPQETTLNSRSKIYVWLKPKAKESAGANANPTVTATSGSPGSGSFDIERLLALDDVHLRAPGKTMDARDRLDALFETPPAPAVSIASAPASASGSAPDSSPTAVAAAADAGPAAPAAEKAPEKPAEPEVNVRANVVWALIRNRPDQKLAATGGGASAPGSAPGGFKGEVQQVRLRGGVVFHQDPEPGKLIGTDVTGEALDVSNQGNGKSRFTVHSTDPSGPSSANPPTTRLVALGAKPTTPPKPEDEAPPATVTTEEFKVTGPIIGLDQTTDRAWVQGPGTLKRMADPNLLTDKSDIEETDRLKTPLADKPKPKPAPRQEMTISWKSEMRFFGRPTEPDVEQVGWAEFYTGVRAEMEDRLIVCQDMKVYLDRTVSLVRPRGETAKPAEPGAEAEPPAEMTLIECFHNVVAISRKVDPVRRILVQQQRIMGDHLTYDKVSGDFHVPGAGQVYLWSREGQDAPGIGPNLGAGADEPSRPRAIRASDPARPSTPRTSPAVIGRNGSSSPSNRPPAAPGDLDKPIPPLTLIQVSFTKEMRGRFTSGKDNESTETRWADFFGEAQSLRAKVSSVDKPFDFDHPPDNATYLSAETMRLVSEPTPGATNPSRNFLKAWENAEARADGRVIQGDLITYDSQSELFYAYGLDGRKAILAQQVGVGQPFSSTRVDAFRYNNKTGEHQMIAPMTIELLDSKSAIRPGPGPEPKPTPKKNFRAPLRLPGRSSPDRKAFNGR